MYVTRTSSSTRFAPSGGKPESRSSPQTHSSVAEMSEQSAVGDGRRRKDGGGGERTQASGSGASIRYGSSTSYTCRAPSS